MTAPDPMVGSVVAGRYEVLRLVGKGGMGSIYEVRHVKLKRTFALKKLASGLAGDSDALARFQREADVIAGLRHPNIVEVVDWETLEDGAPCLIMEFLRGDDLDKRLSARGPLAWSAIARIGDAVMSALSVAHRAGIVHRDLKPQNIFLAVDDAGEEHVKLLDFGVSKIQSSKSVITADQRLLGTPLYMSPEQADGRQEEVSPAADVWAMGAILYEMATARAAFAATSTPSILYRICYGEPEPLAQHRPDAPPAFVALVSAACARDERRLRSIDELRRGLREALADHARFAEPLVADSASTLPIPPRREPRAGATTTLSSATGQRTVASPSRRARTSLGIAAAAAALATGIGYLALRAPSETATSAAPTVTEAPRLTPKITPLVVAKIAPPNEAAARIGEAAGIAPPERAAVLTHTIRVLTRPANARLTLDGVPVEGPSIALRPDGRAHTLRASASGFADETRALDAATPDSLEIALKRRATTRTEPAKAAPPPAATKTPPRPIVPLDP